MGSGQSKQNKTTKQAQRRTKLAKKRAKKERVKPSRTLAHPQSRHDVQPPTSEPKKGPAVAADTTKPHATTATQVSSLGLEATINVAKRDNSVCHSKGTRKLLDPEAGSEPHPVSITQTSSPSLVLSEVTNTASNDDKPKGTRENPAQDDLETVRFPVAQCADVTQQLTATLPAIGTVLDSNREGQIVKKKKLLTISDIASESYSPIITTAPESLLPNGDDGATIKALREKNQFNDTQEESKFAQENLERGPRAKDGTVKKSVQRKRQKQTRRHGENIFH